MRVADRKVLWRAALDTGGRLSSQTSFIGSMVEKLVERMLDDGLLTPYGGDPARQRPYERGGNHQEL